MNTKTTVPTSSVHRFVRREAWGLRHYGANQFDSSKFDPIRDQQFVKPEGGLWTSPINSEYGWKEWCLAEDFGDLTKHFDVSFSGNVLVIDCLKDLEQLEWATIADMIHYPLFEPLVSSGVDAVHLTVRGQDQTRFSRPHNLYGWDCESVLVMRAASLTTNVAGELPND